MACDRPRVRWTAAVLLVAFVGGIIPLCCLRSHHDAHRLETMLAVVSALVGGVCVTTGIMQCLEVANLSVPLASATAAASFFIIYSLEQVGKSVEARIAVKKENVHSSSSSESDEKDYEKVEDRDGAAELIRRDTTDRHSFFSAQSDVAPAARSNSFGSEAINSSPDIAPARHCTHCCAFPCCCGDNQYECRVACAVKGVRGSMEGRSLVRAFRHGHQLMLRSEIPSDTWQRPLLDELSVDGAGENTLRGRAARFLGYAITKIFIPFLLLICFSLHSLVEGMGLGATGNVSTLGVGIVLHKGLAGFSVGASLLESEISVLSYISAIVAFSLMTPVGVLLAACFESSATTRGLLTAATGGTFLFIGTAELLPRTFNDQTHLLTKVALLFVGGGVCMTAETLTK